MNYDPAWSYMDDTMKKASKVAPRCYESHPALPIGDYLIYGGSCGTPTVKDADIYIGFDYNIRQTEDAYPWNNKVIEVYFPIKDQHAPVNVIEFKKMVTWTVEQLRAGKKIHAGCIGGHGRTGLFFAALVAQMLGEADAITYVRQHYCEKAVESQEQVDFLHKHFGITKVEPRKMQAFASAYKGKVVGEIEKTWGTASDIFPVASAKSIWARKKH